MPSVADILGSSAVIDRSRDSVSVDRFCEAGKVVGLYFSSAWCVDRAFTPFLAGFYVHFKTTDGGQGFEIIYVSGDKDKDCFEEYFDEMPWYAISYDDLPARSKLWKRFKVHHTPTLILLDGATGNVITTEGRDCLSDDIEGKFFPWATKPLADILSGELMRGTEMVDSKSALHGKVKGFFFSAHWCPPCRIFTPLLASVYEKLAGEDKNFEVIFVSSDRSDSSFSEYFNSMPGWLAVPYKDRRIIQLTRHFGVGGIPTLVLVDENDKIISHNARFIITNDPDGKNFPWVPEPVQELTESSSITLHESAALIYFSDGEVELIEKGRQLLKEVHDSYMADYNSLKDTLDEIPELRFFIEGPESDEVADTIRSFAQLDNRKPLVAIFEPTEQRVYCLPETVVDITRAEVESLIADFKKGVLQYDPLAESPE